MIDVFAHLFFYFLVQAEDSVGLAISFISIFQSNKVIQYCLVYNM